MKLIDNLNAINTCKEDIRTALIDKGVDMDGVEFSGYAEKIASLQFESGGGGSTAPSADYIYTNGYREDDAAHEIIFFVPYEIELDSNNQFVIELMCPEEIPSYEGGTYYDVIFAMEIPETYDITKFELYDFGTTDYYVKEYKVNPRYSTVVRNGVTYNSYVRKVWDNKDIASEDVQYEPLKYKITIEKK